MLGRIVEVPKIPRTGPENSPGCAGADVRPDAMKSTPGEARLLAGLAKLRGRTASAGERLTEPVRAILECVLIIPRVHLEPRSQRLLDRDCHRFIGPDDMWAPAALIFDRVGQSRGERRHVAAVIEHEHPAAGWVARVGHEQRIGWRSPLGARDWVRGRCEGGLVGLRRLTRAPRRRKSPKLGTSP